MWSSFRPTFLVNHVQSSYSLLMFTIKQVNWSSWRIDPSFFFYICNLISGSTTEPIRSNKKNLTFTLRGVPTTAPVPVIILNVKIRSSLEGEGVRTGGLLAVFVCVCVCVCMGGRLLQDHTFPVNRIRHTSENITLLRATYVVGNEPHYRVNWYQRVSQMLQLSRTYLKMVFMSCVTHLIVSRLFGIFFALAVPPGGKTTPLGFIDPLWEYS